MAAPKSEKTIAIEQFACPNCGAQKEERCTNAAGRNVPPHKDRRALLCGQTFMGLPESVAFCARRTNHKTRHQKLDKSLEWSRELDERDVLEELNRDLDPVG